MRIVIWGAGGHGEVVADACSGAGFALAGWIDRNATGRSDRAPEPAGEAELRALLSRCDARAVALGVGDNRRRHELAAFCGEHLAPPVIHPDATVSPSAQLGSGTVVLPRAVVNARTMIGPAVIVNSAAVVEHDCRLGAAVHVSPGAVLGGDVQVGEGAWVGAGAVVLPGIRVGDWAVVGAGAVVTRDVAPGVTVVGVPARPLVEAHKGAP